MPERARCDGAEMCGGDVLGAIEGREGACTAQQGEFAAHAIGADSGTELCGLAQHGIGDGERCHLLARAFDFLARLVISLGPLGSEAFGIAIKGIATLDYFDARIEIGRGGDFDGESEAIEQLRAEIAFFGIAAADEDKARGMAHADSFALDDILASGGDVEQEVHEMIFEEIDLVDVEVAAMRAREESGLVGFFAAGEGAFEIECADDPIFGGAEREVNDRDRCFVCTKFFAGGFAGEAVVAFPAFGVRVASVAAARDHGHGREEGGEGADGGGLSGPAMSEDENPTYSRVDRGQQDGPLHLILPDDRREGEGDEQELISGGRVSGG